MLADRAAEVHRAGGRLPVGSDGAVDLAAERLFGLGARRGRSERAAGDAVQDQPRLAPARRIALDLIGEGLGREQGRHGEL